MATTSTTEVPKRSFLGRFVPALFKNALLVVASAAALVSGAVLVTLAPLAFLTAAGATAAVAETAAVAALNPGLLALAAGAVIAGTLMTTPKS